VLETVLTISWKFLKRDDKDTLCPRRKVPFYGKK
jgi:hypothetical protein